MGLKKVTVLGRDIVVGDVIEFLGTRRYTVTGFQPHKGLLLDNVFHPARVAISEEGRSRPWGITIFDNDPQEVLREVPDEKLAANAAFLSSLLGR